jgi:hypothetical protein
MMGDKIQDRRLFLSPFRHSGLVSTLLFRPLNLSLLNSQTKALPVNLVGYHSSLVLWAVSSAKSFSEPFRPFIFHR